jgi:hypothetical protein
MTKYNAIILPDKVFISDTSGNSYYPPDLSAIGILFDGQKATPTNKKGWFELPKLPQKVEKIIKPSPKLIGFKLKDGYQPSDKLPEKVDPEFFAYIDDDSDDENHYKNKEIMGLYEQIREEQPEYKEQIEFEISTIAHKNSNWKFVPAPQNVQHYLLDEITKHPDILQDEKCFLASEESYKRIREFVKTNINPQVAYVCSDYDFHFSVSKRIALHEKEKYQRNVKPFAKRPKYVDDYRTTRSIKVYDIIPKPEKRASYSEKSDVAPVFEGDSYEDLEAKISEYLQELINKINEPLQDCPHCKGKGVINP